MLYPEPARSFYQFLWDSDLVDAYATILTSGLTGIYNIAPADQTSVEEISSMTGARLISGPLRLLKIGADLLFRLRLAPFSGHWVTLGDPLLDSQLLRSTTNWRPSMSSAEALQRYISVVARQPFDHKPIHDQPTKEFPMDRTRLEARLSHVAAVRRHLPELADKLEALGLMAAEDPATSVVGLWKEHDGPRLTAPKDLGGLGATCVETFELQRGIGYLSPSLAAASTMHYLSVAGLADFAKTTDEETVGLIKSLIENRTVFASGFSEGTISGSVFRPTMAGHPGRRRLHASPGARNRAASPTAWTASWRACYSMTPNSGPSRSSGTAAPDSASTPLWTSSPLSAAQTHEVIFQDVFVPNELMMVSDVEDPDGRNEKSGYVLFGLIITAGYVGAATRLALKLADRPDFTEADFVELFSPVEGVWRALRMIAERYDAGDRSDAPLRGPVVDPARSARPAPDEPWPASCRGWVASPSPPIPRSPTSPRVSRPTRSTRRRCASPAPSCSTTNCVARST